MDRSDTSLNEIKNEVYWYTLKKPEIVSLEGNLSVDMLVIGGGMAGLTAAHNLLGKGLKIAVLEKDFCGGGASGKSSGFITPDSELEFADLHEKYGKRDAETIWEYGMSGVEEIRTTVKKYDLDCDFEMQDSFFVANDKKSYRDVKDEYDLQKESGYEISLYHKNKMKEVLGSDGYWGSVRAPHTFGMSAYLYCQALKDILIKEGVSVYEGTNVEKIEEGKVLANGHKIEAKQIIVSVDRFLPSLGIYPKAAYFAETFLTVSKPLSDEEIRSIFPKEHLMVWDTDLIYQYYRIIGGNRLMVGASTLPKTYIKSNDTATIISKIKRYETKKFGRIFDIEYIWPGLIGVSKDFLPLVGRHHEMKSVYYISGCAGLPWAAASGKYIAEKIMTGRADMDRFFDAKRKFPVRDFIQAIIRKPLAFALSHGIVKYFQK